MALVALLCSVIHIWAQELREHKKNCHKQVLALIWVCVEGYIFV